MPNPSRPDDHDEIEVILNEAVPDFVSTGDPFAKVETIEAVIKKGMSEISTYERGGRIYASASAYCARQTFLYSMDSDTVVISPTSTAYMKLGIAIENMLLSALLEQDALLFAGYKLPEIGINMGGKVDAIVYVDGKISVLEVKSCTNLPMNPKPEHRAQALMYAAVTGFPASVLYFSRKVADYKSQLLIKNLPLNATKDELLATMFTACYAHFAMEMGVIPPMPIFESQASCGFCKFIDNCWNGRPFNAPVVSPEEHKLLVEKATALAEQLMDPEVVASRRTGILKFITKHGNDFAFRLLSKRDWAEFI